MECVVKGIPFYYQEYGEGKAILMIHGWPADHRHMVSTFEPLFEVREGWKRIYPDLPGMGKTPGVDWIDNQDQMLDILLHFTDQVIPEQPFAVIGVSYGGLLAQGLVYRKPQTLLGSAFIVPGLDVKQGEKELPDRVILVRDEALLSELENDEAEFLQAMATVQSRELIEWLRINAFPASEIADQDFLERVYSDFQYLFDVNDFSVPFEKPVLFLTGRQDSVSGYANVWNILENFPRASYVVLDRAGHAVAIEQKGLFQPLMHEWLNRVEESSN